MIDSRDKGKRGELEVVHLLRAFGWPEAERNSTGRRQLGRDILKGPPGCVIDAKWRQRLNVASLMRELEGVAETPDLPMLFHRGNDEPWRATLRAETLLTLLKFAETALQDATMRAYLRRESS